MGVFIPGRFVHRLAFDAPRGLVRLTTYRYFGAPARAGCWRRLPVEGVFYLFYNLTVLITFYFFVLFSRRTPFQPSLTGARQARGRWRCR
jgi:hypothetical protein